MVAGVLLLDWLVVCILATVFRAVSCAGWYFPSCDTPMDWFGFYSTILGIFLAGFSLGAWAVAYWCWRLWRFIGRKIHRVLMDVFHLEDQKTVSTAETALERLKGIVNDRQL